MRAGAAVQTAKRKGILIPQPCEVCGTTNRIQAHHENYSKPLEVRWLCSLHHRRRHKEIGAPLVAPGTLFVAKVPNDLMRDLKITALETGRTLRQLVIDLLTAEVKA